MLKTKVILSKVTNLSDARYAAGMGVDFIGFDLNPESEYFVTAAEVNTISEWLSGVSFIGEVAANTSHDEYKIDFEQTADLDLVTSLEEPILMLNVNNENINTLESLADQFEEKTSFFILHASPKTIKEHSALIARICLQHECYISTELSIENLDNILRINPLGLVLYGTKEAKPGLSTYDGIADILEMLEE